MNGRSRISVCLLTFNHVAIIESTVETVLRQSVTDCEIILSDDCSTDGTWERICEIAAREPRVRAVQTPRNVGMPGNANFAVGQAVGEYVALLHHDDLYRVDLLEKWAGVLDRHLDVTFVFNEYGIDGIETRCVEHMPSERIDGRWLIESYLFPRWGCVIRGTAMIRRSAWDLEEGMRAEYGLLADVDLWMRLAMRGPIGYVNEPVISVRQQRPSYYPDIYRADTWSWQRLKYLYEIHGANRLAYLPRYRRLWRLHWWGFRIRLSMETAKWITYALVRRKKRMAYSCGESTTPYDLYPLRAYRALVLAACRLLG